MSEFAIAGRISQFVSQWECLTSDAKILDIVNGLELEFVDNTPPIQWQLPKCIIFNEAESAQVDVEIARLLHKGVLRESYHEFGEFINNIFTRPKKDGTSRMILNLKPLNEYVKYRKFKMDTLKTALHLIHKNCFMANLDIRDAYMVKISPPYQKYLKFQWRNKLYQYTALPNGYAAAPRVFTKLLKPIFAHLRELGITVMGYIDDVYIQGETYDECKRSVALACEVLESC